MPNLGSFLQTGKVVLEGVNFPPESTLQDLPVNLVADFRELPHRRFLFLSTCVLGRVDVLAELYKQAGLYTAADCPSVRRRTTPERSWLELLPGLF